MNGEKPDDGFGSIADETAELTPEEQAEVDRRLKRLAELRAAEADIPDLDSRR